MTREEAIKVLNNFPIDFRNSGGFEAMEALKIAILALRPVSREQVEKVWRGEWIGDNEEKVGTIEGSPIKSSTCSACGNWLVGSDEYDCAGYFCPACGAAQTDEAVDILLKRLEALKDGSTTD